MPSVVTVAGICKSVVEVIFLTCNHGAGASGGGEYRSVSRLGLLIGNGCRRRAWVQAVLECADGSGCTE